MNKLELKHLAPYLPYGLKITVYGDFEMKLVHDSKPEDLHTISIKGVLEDYHCKTILRPLSELNTDEIFSDSAFCSEIIIQDLESIWMSYDSPCMADFVSGYHQLLENNFDVFGLIEKGLAIDINTLSK